MRALVIGLLTATILGGCASGTTATKSAATSSAGAKVCALQSAGKDVLKLSVPTDAECTPKDGSLTLSSKHREFNVWLVADAASIDEAAKKIDSVIAPEFKEFSAKSTDTLTIAGRPAKRISGSGKEADDGDPGEAEVIVFNAGGRIFIACVHGESLAKADREWMDSVVETSQSP